MSELRGGGRRRHLGKSQPRGVVIRAVCLVERIRRWFHLLRDGFRDWLALGLIDMLAELAVHLLLLVLLLLSRVVQSLADRLMRCWCVDRLASRRVMDARRS